MPGKIFILAGESSGDAHAARLVAALRRRRPELDFCGMGGPQMAACGVRLRKDLEGMQVIGFSEVIARFGFFRRVFRQLEQALEQEAPAVVILVDYPGFNLRFAQAAHKRGYKTAYYIAPQVWAWHTSRAYKLARHLDLVCTIFPFEESFLREHGVNARFVGHPLLDELEVASFPAAACALRQRYQLSEAQPLLLLLPGSRQAEVERHLPAFWGAALRLRERDGLPVRLATVVADTARGHPRYDELPEEVLRLEQRELYAALAAADAALCVSGTVTLQAGIVGTPMLIAYAGPAFSYWLGRMLLTIPAIGLVNILLGRPVCREFYQHQVAPSALYPEARRLLTDREYAQAIRAELLRLRQLLGGPGAAARAAEAIGELADRSP